MGIALSSRPSGPKRQARSSQIDYDILVRDLVNFMTWMAEPNQLVRKQTGYVVLLVLFVLLVLAYLLYKEFWKDVH